MPKYLASTPDGDRIKRVLVDGKEVDGAFEADTDAGYVKHFLRNEAGNRYAAIRQPDGSWLPVAGKYRTPGCSGKQEAAWAEVRGVVTVEFWQEGEQEAQRLSRLTPPKEQALPKYIEREEPPYRVTYIRYPDGSEKEEYREWTQAAAREKVIGRTVQTFESSGYDITITLDNGTRLVFTANEDLALAINDTSVSWHDEVTP